MDFFCWEDDIMGSRVWSVMKGTLGCPVSWPAENSVRVRRPTSYHQNV